MSKNGLKEQMEENREHIRALLFEKIAGSISASDDELVNAAIENDAAVAEMWQHISRELGDPESRRFINSGDPAQSWDQIRHQLQLQPKPAKTFRMQPWRAAAAVLLILLVAGGAYYFWKKPGMPMAVQAVPEQKTLQLQLADGSNIPLPTTATQNIKAGVLQLKTNGNQLDYTVPDNTTNEWATLMVPGKLDYKIVLKDGTEVWLNSLSSLRFPYIFQGKNREVYLTGEAYFKVAANAEQPFIVHTGETAVEVLGTSFNINAYEPAHVITSLVEGAVISRTKGASVKLTPGYEAMYEGGKFNTLPFDADNTLSWMNGISHFHDTKLSSIAVIISRWYEVPIVFDNPALANETLSGAIDKRKPLDIFLTNIAISSGVHYYYKDNVLHLK